MRDARIAQIYEGTNGVQALDLLGRKVLRDGGATANEFIASMRADVNGVAIEYRERSKPRSIGSPTSRSGCSNAPRGDPTLAGAASVDYLDLFALTTYAWLWARMATIAPADEFGAAKRHTAEFFYARLLPRSLALAAAIDSRVGAIMGMPADVILIWRARRRSSRRSLASATAGQGCRGSVVVAAVIARRYNDHSAIASGGIGMSSVSASIGAHASRA